MMYVIVTLVLLSILIFVHELGHFLAARWAGVRVETFSMGFGPKLLKKKWMGTEFAISAIPFGGYVKMFGDEFGKALPPEEARVAYLSKPAHKKIMIAFAGPTFNIVFAALIFTLSAFIGINRLAPKLGTIFPDTKAYMIGFRTSDEVLAINDEAVRFGDDIINYIKPLKDQTATFRVRRPSKPEIGEFEITTRMDRQFGPDEYGNSVQEGFIKGISLRLQEPAVDPVQSGDTAWASMHMPIQNSFVIEQIGDFTIASLEQILPAFQKQLAISRTFDIRGHHINDKDKSPELKRIDFEVTIPQSISQIEHLHDLGLNPSELRVLEVVKDRPAEQAGLSAGDIILAVGDQRLNFFYEFQDLTQEYGHTQTPMPIHVERDGERMTLSVLPEKLDPSQEDAPWLRMNHPFAVGFINQNAFGLHRMFYRETNIGVALWSGITQTGQWTRRFAVGIWKLVTGQASIKMFSGPLYIGKIAGDWFREGIRQFLFLLAIISLNLGIINLVPLPILDGGHILIFSIEGIIRRPLSTKLVEIAYQASVVFIILLTLFIVYNDILKLLRI